MKKICTALLLCVGVVFGFCAAQNHERIQAGIATYNEEDPNLKALHAELDIGTRIRVTNRINNKTVIVTVNGRIPPDPERIIHISKGAGDNIELSPVGATPVLIEILGGRRRSPAPVEPAAAE
jgi:rare lipoprotein A